MGRCHDQRQLGRRGLGVSLQISIGASCRFQPSSSEQRSIGASRRHRAGRQRKYLSGNRRSTTGGAQMVPAPEHWHENYWVVMGRNYSKEDRLCMTGNDLRNRAALVLTPFNPIVGVSSLASLASSSPPFSSPHLPFISFCPCFHI